MTKRHAWLPRLRQGNLGHPRRTAVAPASSSSTLARTPFRPRSSSASPAAWSSICAGTSGYNGDVDLRYLWTRQKRFQGSHFANAYEARAANQLVLTARSTPASDALLRSTKWAWRISFCTKTSTRTAIWRSLSVPGSPASSNSQHPVISHPICATTRSSVSTICPCQRTLSLSPSLTALAATR